MTRQEKNAVSAGLLVFATATEMFMKNWLRMENITLVGKNKMLWNNMQRSVKAARFYYEQFMDNVASTIYEEDKDCNRIDQLMQDASDMARMYLTSVNCSQNGYDQQAVIDAMNRLLANEENPDILVGEKVVEMFKVR